MTCLALKKKELTAKTQHDRVRQTEHEADLSTRSINQPSLDVNIL